MSSVSRPHSYAPDDPIVADDINDDFDTLYDFINGSVVTSDASRAFTGIPSLPAANPTTANQAVRKQYVDDVTKGVLTKQVISNPLFPMAVDTFTYSGAGLTFPMPDLTAANRAVKLTFGTYGFSLTTGGGNVSAVQLRMVRASDNTPIADGWWTKGNGLLDGPRIEFTGWLFDNNLFTAGSNAVVYVNGLWRAGPSGGTATLQANAYTPAVFVAELV